MGGAEGSRSTRVLLFAFTLVLDTAACAAAATLSPSELLANASTHNGQSVTVTGTVAGTGTTFRAPEMLAPRSSFAVRRHAFTSSSGIRRM